MHSIHSFFNKIFCLLFQLSQILMLHINDLVKISPFNHPRFVLQGDNVKPQTLSPYSQHFRFSACCVSIKDKIIRPDLVRVRSLLCKLRITFSHSFLFRVLCGNYSPNFSQIHSTRLRLTANPSRLSSAWMRR